MTTTKHFCETCGNEIGDEGYCAEHPADMVVSSPVADPMDGIEVEDEENTYVDGERIVHGHWHGTVIDATPDAAGRILIAHDDGTELRRHPRDLGAE